MKLAALLIAVPALAHAGTTTEIHQGDDLFGKLHTLVAGDTVIVHAGTYMTPGLVSVTWTGTLTDPIEVVAAAGEARPKIVGTLAQNTLDIGGSYFTLQGFEITGGSHGVRLAASDHATLDDLVLHDLGDVGISCNRDAQDCSFVTITHNEIYDTGHAGTGEGMYLGCNNAACSFHDSLVANNYVHDVGGDQGDGIEIKTGAYANVVRDNVIVRPKYPGITMYGYAGTGAPNVVEGNVVLNALTDNGIQIVGQIIVRNNIVIGAAANGIQSKASQGETPHDLQIIHNTIVGAAVCLKSNDWATATGQVVANNALYCGGMTAIDLNGGAPGATVVANRGTGGSTVASGFTAGAAGDIGTGLDVYPSASSPLVDGGDAAHSTPLDFNGTARSAPPDIGAYEHTTATNPGWMIGEGFKQGVSSGGTDGPAQGGDAGDPPDDLPSPPTGCGCRTSDRGGLLLAGLVGLALQRRRRHARVGRLG